MKRLNKFLIAVLVFAFTLGLAGPITAFAATTPNLRTATSYAVLSGTYTNTAAGIINGDLGYTTGPSVTPTVNGLTVTPKAPQAGLDQDWALHNLTGQAATYTFPTGAVDLAIDTSRGGTTGEYTPGVYVINGAADIGTAGITLTGGGTYIFIINGALNSVANSEVRLTGGASVCDVFWTPTETTLGANSIFVGTDIDNAGITVGDNVTWSGRALNFATTVTTNNDTITVPATCVAADVAATAAETAAAAAQAAAAQAAATAAAAAAARLPSTGIAPTHSDAPINIAIVAGVFALSTLFVLIRRKKRAI